MDQFQTMKLMKILMVNPLEILSTMPFKLKIIITIMQIIHFFQIPMTIHMDHPYQTSMFHPQLQLHKWTIMHLVLQTLIRVPLGNILQIWLQCKIQDLKILELFRYSIYVYLYVEANVELVSLQSKQLVCKLTKSQLVCLRLTG